MSEYVLGAGGAVAEIRRTTILNHVRATLSYSVYKKRPVFKLRGARTAIHSHGEEGAVRMYRSPGLRIARTAIHSHSEGGAVRMYRSPSARGVKNLRFSTSTSTDRNTFARPLPRRANVSQSVRLEV